MRRFAISLLLIALAPAALAAQTEEDPVPFVAVNQLGYAPHDVKIAVVPHDSTEAGLEWALVDEATGETVMSDTTPPGTRDEDSGDTVTFVDFSAHTAPGTYTLRVGEAISAPFRIADGLYGPLTVDALRYFYLNRSGIALEARYAGDAYARAAGHATDESVACFQGTAGGREWPGCDYRVDGSGGWYDAGDFGKYVVNAGITVWTLQDLHERNPEAVPDGALNIPESGNGAPDVLDEARWEVEWMLRMQVPDGQPDAGMVHHKLHGLQWDGLPAWPETDFDVDDPARGRYVMPVSTGATLNLAAVAAQCARLWRPFDAPFADRCLAAAETAYDAAIQNPNRLYDPAVPGNGGGPYDDRNMADEFLWAAAELYVTTGAQRYLDAVRTNAEFVDAAGWVNGAQDVLYWGDVSLLAVIALARGEGVPDDVRATAREYVLTVANHYLDRQNRSGYRTPLAEYAWGSNSDALNRAMVLANAYDLSGEVGFRDGVVLAMDWMLGRNALDFSFVTGYGANTPHHPHHRVWAGKDGFPPPPAGALVGGPNSNPSDPPAMQPEITRRPRAKRYIDHIDSYSTNEVAINWNAPLAWVAAWLTQPR